MKKKYNSQTLRPILIYYINVGNIDEKDVVEYIKKVKINISLKSDASGKFSDITELYIPLRNGETHVEVLYL